MGEPAVTIVSQSRDFSDKSPQELEAILQTLTSGGELPADAPPVETPEPPVETPEPVEAAPEVVAAPETTPEPDLQKLREEMIEAERSEMAAKYELLQAHASRMAGKIGYLEQKLQSGPATSEPFEPQTQQEVDRLTQLEQRLAQSESQRQKDAVSQAVQQQLASMDGPWTKEYEKELAPLLPKYAPQIQEAASIPDVEMARKTVAALVTIMQSEAIKSNRAEAYKLGLERKEAATADLAKAKKAQTPSGSGGIPTPPPKPKSFKDMTAAEADAWLRENVR